jgi:hypothetical protein
VKIFVSHTSSDSAWAFWLAGGLKGLCHEPHVREWEIGDGEDIYGWMETPHRRGPRRLCVMSEEHLKAPYSTLERRGGLWHAAAKQLASFGWPS